MKSNKKYEKESFTQNAVNTTLFKDIYEIRVFAFFIHSTKMSRTAVQTHTAFSLSQSEQRVPGTAPAAKEKVRAAKVYRVCKEAASRSAANLYSFCPTFRILPVQMVVLWAVPIQVRNRQS